MPVIQVYLSDAIYSRILAHGEGRGISPREEIRGVLEAIYSDRVEDLAKVSARTVHRGLGYEE